MPHASYPVPEYQLTGNIDTITGHDPGQGVTQTDVTAQEEERCNIIANGHANSKEKHTDSVTAFMGVIANPSLNHRCSPVISLNSMGLGMSNAAGLSKQAQSSGVAITILDTHTFLTPILHYTDNQLAIPVIDDTTPVNDITADRNGNCGTSVGYSIYIYSSNPLHDPIAMVNNSPVSNKMVPDEDFPSGIATVNGLRCTYEAFNGMRTDTDAVL